MERKSLKLTTNAQFTLLLEEIRRFPQLAKGAPVFGANRQQCEEEWKKIRGKLNSLGPPIRTTVEWKRVWADLKSRTKRKLGANAAEMQRTDGEPFCTTVLTHSEQGVVDILNLATNISASGTIHGVVERDEDDSQFASMLPELFETSTSDHNDSTAAPTAFCNGTSNSTIPGVPRPKRRKQENDYLALLQQQTIQQEDISHALERIATTLEMFLAGRKVSCNSF